MSKRLSSSLLALGLMGSLLAGCQAAVPAAVRPAASFGLGPVEAAAPESVPTIRTLSGDVALDEPTAATMPVALAPSAAPAAPSTVKPVDNADEVEELALEDDLDAAGPTTDEATDALPTEVADAPETDMEPPVQPGVWEMTWHLDGEDARQETYHLTLETDGTVTAEEGAPDPEFENVWAGNEVQFAGGVFSMGPQMGMAPQRYRLQVVTPDQMVGTVALWINFRWVEVAVTASRVAL